MNKENVVYVQNGVIFSHKKVELLPFGTTQMKPEEITLSKISQIQKNKFYTVT